MKILTKIIVIFFFSIIIIGQFSIVFADDEKKKEEQESAPGFESMFSMADNFLKQKLNKDDQVLDINRKDLRYSSSQIYNILFSIGVVLTVAFSGILGIKFMIASAEDKAKIKEMMIPYVVGCVVIYGAFGIWKFVMIVFNGF